MCARRSLRSSSPNSWAGCTSTTSWIGCAMRCTPLTATSGWTAGNWRIAAQSDRKSKVSSGREVSIQEFRAAVLSAAAVIDPRTPLLPLCSENRHSTVGSCRDRLLGQDKTGNSWLLRVPLAQRHRSAGRASGRSPLARIGWNEWLGVTPSSGERTFQYQTVCL